jgi:MFS transporter, SHS family, lactate transporter
MSATDKAVPANERMTSWQWRVFAANYLGLIFEAYDLTIYSLLVVSISHYFHVPTWYSFLVLTMSYTLRGIGGLVFGHIADKVGRRNALVFTVLGYSLATGLTGASWNVTSLLVFRGLSGLFIGGEYVGYSYTMEIVPKRWRGHFSGAIVSSYSAGFLLATASFGIATAVMGSNFASGGDWRWLFFVGIAPALIALWLRLGVEESPAWQRATSDKAPAGLPLFEIFKPKYLRRTLHSWIMMAALLWAYDVVVLAQPTMLNYFKLPSGRIAPLILIANVGSLIAAFTGGWLSQRLGRRRALLVIGAAAIPVAFLAAPFWMLPTIPVYLYLAVFGFVGSLAFEAGFGVMPAFLSERYPTEVRATGATGTYNLGQVVAGFSVTVLAVTFGGSAISFTAGIVINAVMALVILLVLVAFSRETRDTNLDAYAAETSALEESAGSRLSAGTPPHRRGRVDGIIDLPTAC